MLSIIVKKKNFKNIKTQKYFIFRATRILNADCISKKIQTLPPKRRIN